MRTRSGFRRWDRANPPATVIESWDRARLAVSAVAALSVEVLVVLVAPTWGWRLAVSAAVLTVAIAAGATRFRLEIDAGGILLSRHWIGIQYSRTRLPLDVRVSLAETLEAPPEGVVLSTGEAGAGEHFLGARRCSGELRDAVVAAIERHRPPPDLGRGPPRGASAPA